MRVETVKFVNEEQFFVLVVILCLCLSGICRPNVIHIPCNRLVNFPTQLAQRKKKL